MTPPRPPFVAVGGSAHGEVLDVEPRQGLFVVVPLAESSVFDPAAPLSPIASLELRREVYDLRQFAIFDPYSDPREWGDVVPLDDERARLQMSGSVHPERRFGWFLVSSSLDAEAAMWSVLALFGETARAAYQHGTGVWEWLGVFGERHVWDPDLAQYVGAGRAATVEEFAPGVAGMREALERFRVDARAGRRQAIVDRGEYVASRLGQARRRLVAQAAERAQAERVIDPEAALAEADRAGQGWRERADAALADIDRVLGDGTEWTTPATWSPDLDEEPADA